MRIRVTGDRNSGDVSLLTENLELDLAVRFTDFEEAVAFARLWADWINCPEVEILRTPISAAA